MIDRARRPMDRARIVPTLLLTALFFGASGCGGSPYDSAPSGSGSAAGKQDAGRGVAERDKTAGKAPAGPDAAIGAASPDGAANPAANAGPQPGILPEGVLAYPEAVRVESLEIAKTGRKTEAPTGVVMFVSTESDKMKVANWYEQELVSAGWAVVERSGDGEFDLFQKAGREMSVSVGVLPDPKPDGHADKNLLIVIDAN